MSCASCCFDIPAFVLIVFVLNTSILSALFFGFSIKRAKATFLSGSNIDVVNLKTCYSAAAYNRADSWIHWQYLASTESLHLVQGHYCKVTKVAVLEYVCRR